MTNSAAAGFETLDIFKILRLSAAETEVILGLESLIIHCVRRTHLSRSFGFWQKHKFVMADNLDHVFKILLIGDAGVGKSSILLQFTDGYFNENLQSTIGVDFKVKVMEVASPDGKMKRVKVTIWDTAGQERFRTLTSSYYRGAQGIILVYDVARKETFDSLSMWLQEVEQFSMGGGKEVVKLLVGNKVDQPRVIQRDVADDWARSRGMLFMEASAKTKEGISQVFIEVVQKILENPTLLSNTRPAKPGNRASVGSAPQNSSSKGGCC